MFDKDIQGVQKINPNDVSDSLTFPSTTINLTFVILGEMC